MGRRSGISFSHKGSFKNTERFLRKAERRDLAGELAEYGELGVAALQASTPKDSGLTADSWIYEIDIGGEGVTISWLNTNDAKGWFNVAMGIQYGHGTGTGGWVEGIDYINPAMKPIFDEIAEKVWAKIQKW